MNVININNISDFLVVADKYNFLECATPYQGFPWIYNYCKHFLGSKKLNVSCFYNDEQIIGFAPLWQKKYENLSVLEFIGTRGTDYLDFIGSPNCVEFLLNDFIRGDNDLVYLEDIPEDSLFVSTLESFSANNNLAFKMEDNCPAYTLTLPSSVDDYMSRLSKRTCLDYKYDENYMRKHLDSITYIVEGSEGLVRHIALHQNRQIMNKNTGSYNNHGVINFMADFLRSVNVRISFLRAKNKDMASILSVVHNNKVFLITIGFDPEYARYNPGKQLFFADIGDCIKNGYSHYDFSRGSEAYKIKFGAKLRMNKRICIAKDLNHIAPFRKYYDVLNQGKGYNPDF